LGNFRFKSWLQNARTVTLGLLEEKETKEAKGYAHLTASAIASYALPEPVEVFVGRKALLDELAKQFGAPLPEVSKVGEAKREVEDTKRGVKQTPAPIAASPRQLVLCTGLGGVGKTQLALQYAHRTAKAYRHKFWFTADSSEALALSYRRFAIEKNLLGEGDVPDEEVISAVKQWFVSQPNWLIIYDNVNFEHSEGTNIHFKCYKDFESYLPTKGTGDILITSRLTDWTGIDIFILEVEVLSPEEAIKLVTQLLKRTDPDTPRLAEILGYLPLALVQASAYISRNKMPIKRYLEIYQEKAAYLLTQKDMPKGNSHEPVFMTWDINLAAIEKEEKDSDKQTSAKELLKFCAYLSPQKIPSRLIGTWHKRAYSNTQEPFEEVRGRLHAYSLIQLNSEDQSIQVHRLVQQVMRERLSAGAQATQLQQTIALLTDAYPQEEVGVGKAWDAIRFGFIPHLEAVIAYHAQYKLAEDINLSLVLSLLAGAYGDLGQVGKKRELLERALAIDEAHYGKAHYQVASTLTSLGSAYGELGQMNKARDVLERALAIGEAHYGRAHYQIASTLNNLGSAYWDLGQAGKARDILERALAIDEAHYGKAHYQVASTLNNLGNAYGALGDVGKQRALLERALAIQEAHYGKAHYQVATTLNNLGNAYGDLGDVSKQRALLERALAIKEAHYGRAHYQVASTLTSLGNAYGNLGQVSKQRALLERALAIKEAHYGKAHYQVASTLTSLGNAYGNLGQVSKKRELLERALAIDEAHYGLMHPELAITLANLAVAYQALKQPQDALQAAQRAYRNLMAHPDYGVNHPETTQCLHYLRSECGFTVAMLQSDNTVLDEKLSAQSSLPITSPSPQESQVATKTPTNTLPMDFSTDRFTEAVEFQVTYDATVHHYFSDLAGRIGNDSQGRPPITVQNSISSASTTFTVLLSTAWLRQLRQNHLEDFHHLCHQLGVRENEMFMKIGLTDPSKQEYKENKSSEIHSMPLTQPLLSSADSLMASIGFVSSSTSTSPVPPSSFSSSLTSPSSASLFPSAARQFSGNNPSFVLLSGEVPETKEKNIQTKRKRKREGEERDEDTTPASNPKSPKPKPPGGAWGK
jgi:tetratricopeptide (TPR) repeat protein